MTRDEAFTYVTGQTGNQNLVRHMLAVEAIMRALARHFGADEELWGITGLVHDADYERFKDTPEKHPSVVFDELAKMNADPKMIEAIKAHAWQYSEISKEPENTMEWSLYTADHLSGLLTACALVRPDKQITSVTVDSVMKKWHQPKFAAGCHRDKIEYCQSKLGIPVEEFVGIALTALQDIHGELGL